MNRLMNTDVKPSSDNAKVAGMVKEGENAMKNPGDVIAGMAPSWFSGIHSQRKLAKHDSRTVEEACFDAGVMVASEFVRRMMDYDESLALPIHDLCFFRRKGKP